MVDPKEFPLLEAAKLQAEFDRRIKRVKLDKTAEELYNEQDGVEITFHYDRELEYVMVLCSNNDCVYHRDWTDPPAKAGRTNCAISGRVVDYLMGADIPIKMLNVLVERNPRGVNLLTGEPNHEEIPDLPDEKKKCIIYEYRTTSEW